MIDIPATMPLSLMSFAAGGIQGQVQVLLNKWIDYKFKLKALDSKTYLKDKENARNTKSKRFSITRRILAIMIISKICLSPLIAVLLGVPFWIYYTVLHGGLASLFVGSSTIKLVMLNGLSVTPLDGYLGGMVTSLYFGISDVK